MTSDKQQWYVLYTKPRWEKKVYARLQELGRESYCPINRVRKKWSDRMKWVEEPLFKSYVFVRIPEADQSAIRLVSGVVNFVYWLGKPAVVKESEIAIIRKFLNEYTEVKAEAMAFVPESKWKVQQGAFMDKQVKVLKVQGNKVKVVIESIGYSLVALIDKSNLTVIGK